MIFNQHYPGTEFGKTCGPCPCCSNFQGMACVILRLVLCGMVACQLCRRRVRVGVCLGRAACVCRALLFEGGEGFLLHPLCISEVGFGLGTSTLLSQWMRIPSTLLPVRCVCALVRRARGPRMYGDDTDVCFVVVDFVRSYSYVLGQ